MANRRSGSKRRGLGERLEGKRICVCVGPGGVGKTTVSAALGVGLAARGERVVVVTIDPAKRLASALGLEKLPGVPHRVGDELLAGSGLELSGELWAMTLDVKGTFDGLIARLAPEESARGRILENRIYRELSSAVAGSQELSALVELYDLSRDERFDAIVLDTPPSRNALDFLNTPGRLLRFLDGRALGLFLSPGGFAARLFGRGGALALAVFARASGIDFMGELSEFFGSLAGTIDGFKDRARAVQKLFEDGRRTAFLIVTSPQPHTAREALYLSQKLTDAGMPRTALIFNRVEQNTLDGTSVESLQQLLLAQLGESLAVRVAHNLADLDVLARRDRVSIDELSQAASEPDPILIPQFSEDIRDLAGLARVTEHLFA